jgi:hypothetical protein
VRGALRGRIPRRRVVRRVLSARACEHRAQRWAGERDTGGFERRDERGLLLLARRTLRNRGLLERRRLRQPVERGLESSRSAEHHEARKRSGDGEPVLQAARQEHRLARSSSDTRGRSSPSPRSATSLAPPSACTVPVSASADAVAERFWTLSEDRRGPPDPGIPITGQEDLLVGIRSGRFIAAMPLALVRHLPFDDVVAREVQGLRPAGLAICRPAGDSNPLADAFARAVRAAVIV